MNNELYQQASDTYDLVIAYAKANNGDADALTKEKNAVTGALFENEQLHKALEELTHACAELREKALDLSDGGTLAECVAAADSVVYHAQQQLIALREENKRLKSEQKNVNDSVRYAGYATNDNMSGVGAMANKIWDLRKDKIQLRKALKFYADKDNWRVRGDDPVSYTEHDEGTKARLILERIK